jgi:hypothetical protein
LDPETPPGTSALPILAVPMLESICRYLQTSILLPSTTYMLEAEEDGDVKENMAAGKVWRELAPSCRGRLGEMATHNTKHRLTTSYPMVLISA